MKKDYATNELSEVYDAINESYAETFTTYE